MTKPLTATMAACLDDCLDHGGTFNRFPGGFWAYPGCRRLPHNGHPETHWGTSTIQALVARGRMVYSEWHTGRNGRFSIAVRVLPTETKD